MNYDNSFVDFVTHIGMNFSNITGSVVLFFIKFIFSPVKNFILNVSKKIRLFFLKIYIKGGNGIYHIKNFVDELKGYNKEKNISKKEFIRLSVKRHKSFIFSLRNIFAVVLAFCIVFGVAGIFADYTFAVAVKRNGNVIGFVSEEDDVYSAVNQADGSLKLSNEKCDNVTYKTVFIRCDKTETAENISDKLITDVNNSYSYLCGVYIDGEFICAVKNQSEAQSVLNSVLSSYKTENTNESYSFNSEIMCVYGLYPATDNILWTEEEFSDYIKANPIEVKMQKTETYDVDIDYDTVNINSDSIYQGNSMVLQQGQNGQERVTDILTFVNGVQVAKSELTRITLKSAVSQRVAIGTKIPSITRYTKSFGGVMLWPAPQNCFYLSSYYGYRNGSLHGGIDIISSDSGSCRGRPIVAAAAGTVIAAQYHWSWGNYIKIDHGNGIATLYAHMMDNSFCVDVGDYVYAGQQIGSIGTTGNSTGYHLHFEVYINGTRVNPLPFVYSENVQYID